MRFFKPALSTVTFLMLFSCGEKAVDQVKGMCSPTVTRAVNEVNNRCWYLESTDERTIDTQITYLVEACVDLEQAPVSRCRMTTSQNKTVEITPASAQDLCKMAREADRDTQYALETARAGQFVSPWKELSNHPTRASVD